jgi:hypothetical protein
VEVSSSSTVPFSCVTASVRSSGLTATPRGVDSSATNRLASGTPRTSRRESSRSQNATFPSPEPAVIAVRPSGVVTSVETSAA